MEIYKEWGKANIMQSVWLVGLANIKNNSYTIDL